MYVLNQHERLFTASEAAVGALLDTLSSPTDQLWPHHAWPRMRFDRPLGIGAIGGHGPIRYTVDQYVPGCRVVFRFTAPAGFDGTHSYFIEAPSSDRTIMRHVLEMYTSGPAIISWPLVFRPLHDALIEDSLDCAERALTGQVQRPQQWSPYVRLLRAFLSRRQRRRAIPSSR